MGLVATSPVIADVTGSSKALDSMKIAIVTKMYQQDVNNGGMDNPVVLQQYANQDLQSAMQLEQNYFDKHQMSCNVDYDVLWDAQDPDYTQDKEFSINNKGVVQVSLAQGSNVYYELSCDSNNESAACQVADVILNETGKSLSQHFIETCH